MKNSYRSLTALFAFILSNFGTKTSLANQTELADISTDEAIQIIQGISRGIPNEKLPLLKLILAKKIKIEDMNISEVALLDYEIELLKEKIKKQKDSVVMSNQ